MVKDSTGKMVEKPRYGGTITISKSNYVALDPYRFDASGHEIMSFTFEKLGIANWGTPRDKYDFPTEQGNTPLEFMKGGLLENWEMPDPLTCIFHVRKGIRFADRPPVNGREFTASDVVWNINRIMASPFIDRTFIQRVESVREIDKHTVEMKLKPPAMNFTLRGILDADSHFLIAPETVGKSNEIEKWQNCIGTGPFIVDDVVPNSSVTFVRNPNYWGYDELHPENRLPYSDLAKIIIIEDPSTKLAALRSGKLDQVIAITWQDADSLKKTNPELLYKSKTLNAPRVFKCRVDKEPFTDVRVRQALSMAINRKEMAATFFGGYALPYSGTIGPPLVTYFTPFDQLPDKPLWTTVSIKEILSYNPEKAKKLLAEAGYPNGFTTHIDSNASLDTGYSEILANYLAAIGVKLEIKMYDTAAFTAIRYGRTSTQMLFHWHGQYVDPLQEMNWFADPKHNYNMSGVNDPWLFEHYNKAYSTFDETELIKLVKELEMYMLEKVYYIDLPFAPPLTFWQPWLKGYSGEGWLTKHGGGDTMARCWVDQELKARSKR